LNFFFFFLRRQYEKSETFFLRYKKLEMHFYFILDHNVHNCILVEFLTTWKIKNEFTLGTSSMGKLSHLMTDVNKSWRFCQVLCALNFASLMHEKKHQPEMLNFWFSFKKKTFFFSVRASRHDQRIEWSGSPQWRTRMATTKQQKLLQLKKKKSSIFAFF